MCERKLINQELRADGSFATAKGPVATPGIDGTNTAAVTHIAAVTAAPGGVRTIAEITQCWRCVHGIGNCKDILNCRSSRLTRFDCFCKNRQKVR